MIHDTKNFIGKSINAADGDIGQVSDLYFDDKTWTIRYIVVDTGGWLSGRQVLLSPHAFASRAINVADRLQTHLTMQQIEDSPSIESKRPVSRQFEEEYFRYYGWPTYWGGVGLDPASTPPALAPIPMREIEPVEVNLRSVKDVTGYRIEASDGTAGKVKFFNFDSLDWKVREVVAEIGHWFAGKQVAILVESIQRIDFADSAVYVAECKDDIRNTLDHDIVQAGAGRR